MKNLNLENFGVHEMNAKDVLDVNGGLIITGIFPWVYQALGAVGGAMSDFAHAFKDGFEKGAQ